MHAARIPGFAPRVALLAVLAGLTAASAQDYAAVLRDFPDHIILPQRRAIHIRPIPRPVPEEVRITGVEADVVIRDGIATTTLNIRLHNPGPVRAEAVVLLPVPDQAVVRAFTFEGPGAESSARLLSRQEARRIYDAIVARSRDPALLEFIGLNVVRSSVFPVEPRGRQAVQLTYEQVLPADGDRRDFALPRSEALDCDVPWKVTVQLHDRRPLGAIYSPSHEIEVRKGDANRATITLTNAAGRVPGSFILSYLTVRNPGPAATVFLHPDPRAGGGHFLLLAGAPAATSSPTQLRREVTLVLDRSGSMRGEKIEQAKEAARQLLAGLEPGERFHLIVYNEVVESCSDTPEIVSPESRRRALDFIDALMPRGGTNIHDALLEALRTPPADGFVPVVLFLTDGVPTVGTTQEKAIRELASKGNSHGRRVFTFGVGAEVNTPLLQSVALAARGTATFVLPGEDIEVKVSSVFRRLSGPVFTGPRLAIEENGRAATARTLDVLPQPLPDIFAGDELLVFGRYRGEAPFDLVLNATGPGAVHSIRAHVDPASATTRHSFVPRLWASRRIGVLAAALRDLGADGHDPQRTMHDPATRELIEEIVQLSTEFGILTEYTSFLAEEGSEILAPTAANAFARDKAERQALPIRSGAAALSMEANNAAKLDQRAVNPFNRVYDEALVERETRNIQQLSDAAFYQRGQRWLDSRLVKKGDTAPTAARVVEIGTPEHRTLIDQLVRENRQAAAALDGDVYLEVAGETVLLRNR